MNDENRRPRSGRGIAVLAAAVAAAALAVPASASLVNGGDSGAGESGAPDAPVFLPVQDSQASPAPDASPDGGAGRDGDGRNGWGGRGDCPEKDGGSQGESSVPAPSPQGTAEL